MSRAEIDGDSRIRLECELRELPLAKTVPGARYDAAAASWHFPLSWASCVSLRATFGDALEVGPALSEWAWREVDERIKPCLELRTAGDFEEVPGYEGLYPFQRASAEFLVRAERALLASEMGTGKTPTAIAAVKRVLHRGDRPLPLLVVCPNTMKRTWAAELARWAPDLRVLVLGGGTAKSRKALEAGGFDVVVTNWESLRGLSRLAPYGSIALSAKEKTEGPLNAVGFQAVIADEAHRGKDPRAKQTRALWSVARDARWRWALTGTPVANQPDDLWAIMHFAAPEEWPAHTQFVDRFGLVAWSIFGTQDVVGIRPDARDEFFRILDPRFRRDLKAVVLPQLPEKIPSTRVLEMEPKQEKAYRQMATTMLAELDSGVLAATSPLTRATRLLQLASSMLEQDGDGVTCVEPSCKVDAVQQIVEEAGDLPVAVFAESRKLIELIGARLARHKVPHALVTGRVGEADRQAAIDRFQAGELRALLLTLGAGGEGLTLTAAGALVFAQRSDSLIKNRQATERVHRFGLGHAVQIIDLVTAGTVEEYQQQRRLAGKARVLEEIVRDEDALREMLQHGAKAKTRRRA